LREVDSLVKGAMNKKVTGSFNIEVAIITIIVLAILENIFNTRRTEWSMIDKKAKKFLAQKVGIDKAVILISSVTI